MEEYNKLNVDKTINITFLIILFRLPTTIDL